MRKKFTMLLAALFLVMGTSVAQTWLQPTESTETETYEYYIKNYRDQAYFVTTTKGLDGGAQQLGSANSFTTEKAKVAFKLTKDGKLYSTNTETELILGYTTTGEAANSVQLFAADSKEGYTWNIEAANGGYTLSAGTSSNSWNMHGGKGANIGLYRKTDAGSNWVFVPANDAAKAKAEEAKALYGISTEYYYQIKNVAYSRVLAANANDKATSISTISTADLNQLWAFEATENGTFRLRNAGQGKYLAAATSNNTAWTVAAEGTEFDVDILNFSNKSWTIHASGQDGYGCAHDANWGWDAQVVRWEAVANASQWNLEKTNISLTAQEINFEYSFTYNDVEKFTQSCTGIVGEDYPEITVSFPVGVSATKPTGKLTAQNAGQKISVALSVSELPFFKYADSYANIQYWYYLPMHANERYYMSYVADQEYISLGNGQKVLPLLNDDDHNAYLWAFVGNPVDGFMVVNKAAGDTYVLSSTTTISNDATTFPLMTLLSTIDTETQNAYWYPTSSTHGNNGFFLAQKGYPSNRMNVRDYKLAYWTGGADAGSTFQVTTLATAEDIEMVGSLRNNAGKVGYPKNADKLDGLALNKSTKLDVNVAVKAYKTISDIILPEDGKAYTIANFSHYNGGTTRHLNYTKDAALSVKVLEEGEEPSVFVCKKLSNGAYTFVTVDGKVLTWMHSSEGYKENDAFRGYSSNYAAEYSNYSDWNRITVKKNGTTENDFGHLRLVARRYARDNAPNSSFIIQGNNGNWDRAGDSYFLQTPDVKTECYSSAWILTEVEHANTDAENLAIAKIGALDVRYELLAEGIGGYHYEIEGLENYSKDVIYNATSVDAVNNIASTFAINQPTAGFYRIKSMNGNNTDKKGRFLEADETGMKLAKDGSNPDNKYTSVFYVKDNTILSYSCGQYLNSFDAFAVVGAEPTSWVIEENAGIVGTYALKYEENASHNGYLSDWLNIPTATEEDPQPVFKPTNGLNDANAAWTLEAVVSLPVAVSAAGYATFIAPVALDIPADVTVYTGSIVGNYLNLVAIEGGVIPANTGVIIEAAEGTYNFAVVDDVDPIEDNALVGKYAKSAKNANAKVYTLQNGANGVGFYLFKGQNSEGATTYINGFRAWVELPIESETQALRIRFAGEEGGTTSIELPTVGEEVVVYDLTGRRVEKLTEKGIYIVNGKKVVIK